MKDARHSLPRFFIPAAKRCTQTHSAAIRQPQGFTLIELRKGFSIFESRFSIGRYCAKAMRHQWFDYSKIENPKSKIHHAPRGFTLIELLTVIAIIGILAAIIIPVVGKVRESARKTQSISNVRSCTQAAILFANDNKDMLPYRADPLGGNPNNSNTIILRADTNPYIPWLSQVWFCPIVKRAQANSQPSVTNPSEDWVGRIRYNWQLIPSGNLSRPLAKRRLSSITTPSQALIFWNCSSGGKAGYNEGYAHCGMADGSVKKIKDGSYITGPSNVSDIYIKATNGQFKGFDF